MTTLYASSTENEGGHVIWTVTLQEEVSYIPRNSSARPYPLKTTERGKALEALEYVINRAVAIHQVNCITKGHMMGTITSAIYFDQLGRHIPKPKNVQHIFK